MKDTMFDYDEIKVKWTNYYKEDEYTTIWVYNPFYNYYEEQSNYFGE